MGSQLLSSPMESGALHLWFAFPHDLADEEAAAACALLLSPEEHAHWQRFRHAEKRRESLATRALARVALSHVSPRAPREWAFAVNPRGKPRPEPECGLRFNLSNATELVVCLVAQDAEVGVDVEPFRRAPQILRVVDEVFSPLERSQLAELPEDARSARAVMLWTLKEAYIKARGLGLALPLQKISFVFDAAGGIHLELDPVIEDDPRRWVFGLVEHAAHRIAIVVERTRAWQLTALEVRPPLAAPIKVDCVLQGWFPED